MSLRPRCDLQARMRKYFKKMQERQLLGLDKLFTPQVDLNVNPHRAYKGDIVLLAH